MDHNFTFTNPIIKDYFESESNDNPPVSQLLFLHGHPLIRPNFLQEIENLACQAGGQIQKYKLEHKAKQLEQIAIKIGQQLPELTYSNGPIVLEGLKELYKLCKEITGMPQ